MSNVRLVLTTVITILSASVVGCAGGETGEPMQRADRILFNGRVHTLDYQIPYATAVAILGDRILKVGTDPEILSLAGPDTERIDLDGSTILPGIIDAHLHLKGIGRYLERIDLRGSPSPEAVARKVAHAVGLAPEGAWIRGRGWDQNLWENPEFPTATVLDTVAPDHPVALTRVDGHALWVNGKAMELTGLGRYTRRPAGGQILRDQATGMPTGVLIDNAMDLVLLKIPPTPLETRQKWIEKAGQELLAHGITTVHDAGIEPEEVDLYKMMVEARRLPLRVYAMLGDSNRQFPDDYFAQPPVIGYGDRRFTLRAIKLGVDGALGSRGAALRSPYADDPKNRGLVTLSKRELENITRQALEKGFQVCVHAIGDRGNRIALDAFQSALEAVPTDDPRLRIEHAQILAPADIPRFGQLGLIVSVQPVHATSDMPWVPLRLGEERLAGAYAWKSLHDSPARLAFGSDAPVEGWNPWEGLYAAVTRQDREGWPEGGWLPEQRLSRLEALRAFTLGGAYAAFEEDEKGTLTAGKLADMVVLDRDYFEVPEEEIRTLVPEMTVLGGRVVYVRPGNSSR